MLSKAVTGYLALWISASAAMRLEPSSRIAHISELSGSGPLLPSTPEPHSDSPLRSVHIPDNEPYMNSPCSNGTFSELPFCDQTLDVELRVEDILDRLTLKEMISCLGTSTPALPSIGASAYNWWSEATHGISHVRNDARTPYQGNYALPITTSASFNRSLWWSTAQQIGKEARAFMNAGNAYSTYWAPVINLLRDPRWGRNMEGAGEDPYLSGQYAVNFVRGMERNEADPGHIQAAACCKHYDANTLENWNGSQRYSFNAEVSERDLSDSYMPAFRDCVEQGRVTGLMCSYNAVNGVPSCANDWLLKTVAREAWEFDGYITSDCDADQNVYNAHHYTATPEEAVRDVLRAGTDIDCTSFVPNNAQSALDKGLITVNDFLPRLRNLFAVRMRLGHFDAPGPLSRIGTDVICSDDSIELARDGTRQGTVLLKNNNTVLPLDPSRVTSALVVGPTFNLSYATATYYAGSPCGGKYWNLADGVADHLGRWRVTGLQGLPSVTSNDTSHIAQAIDYVKYNDAVILALGQDTSIESEGRDRYSIAIMPGQLQLARQVAAEAKKLKKVVVAVVLTGGMVDVRPLLNNPHIDAILMGGQPSVTVGGVADVIFGHPVAGRMVQTTYPASFVNQVSLFDMNMRPGKSKWPPFTNPGRTYRFYTKKPVLPFGYGLSYTSWKYEVVPSVASRDGVDRVGRAALDLEQVHALVRGDTDVKGWHEGTGFFVNVTNTGKVDSDDVVLGFMTPPGAGRGGVPRHVLFGFERVHVVAGESVQVYIGAQLEHFTQVGEDGQRRVWPGEYTIHFGVKDTLEHGMGYTEIQLFAE